MNDPQLSVIVITPDNHQTIRKTLADRRAFEDLPA